MNTKFTIKTNSQINKYCQNKGGNVIFILTALSSPE